jgi:hypothetical protein
MVHHVTQMLAEYLDTPDKVESAVKTIIAASSSLHSAIGDDVSGSIAASLAQQASCQDTVQPNGALDTAENDDAPPKVTKKRKSKAGEHSQRHNIGHEIDEMLVDVEEPPQRTEVTRQTFDQEDRAVKKISSSWRWNIDPDNLSAEDRTAAFKRPSDLFAFHALPIVRGMLSPEARSKEIRLRIQSLMDEMPESEYDKWIDSFRKLHDGDEVMLVRIPPETLSTGRTAVTPAPIDSRRRMDNVTGAPRSARRERMQLDARQDPEHQSQTIKRENNVSSNTQEEDV